MFYQRHWLFRCYIFLGLLVGKERKKEINRNAIEKSTWSASSQSPYFTLSWRVSRYELNPITGMHTTWKVSVFGIFWSLFSPSAGKYGPEKTPNTVNFHPVALISYYDKHKCFNWPIGSQCTLSLSPENIRKPEGFLIISGGRERVHWKKIG